MVIKIFAKLIKGTSLGLFLFEFPLLLRLCSSEFLLLTIEGDYQDAIVFRQTVFCESCEQG